MLLIPPPPTERTRVRLGASRAWSNGVSTLTLRYALGVCKGGRSVDPRAGPHPRAIMPRGAVQGEAMAFCMGYGLLPSPCLVAGPGQLTTTSYRRQDPKVCCSPHTHGVGEGSHKGDRRRRSDPGCTARRTQPDAFLVAWPTRVGSITFRHADRLSQGNRGAKPALPGYLNQRAGRGWAAERTLTDWLMEGQRPDHSTIADFVKVHGGWHAQAPA